MSVRGAAFLGIGAMVGAGIFALLGEAGAVAGAAVWLSFLLAGIVLAAIAVTAIVLVFFAVDTLRNAPDAKPRNHPDLMKAPLGAAFIVTGGRPTRRRGF